MFERMTMFAAVVMLVGCGGGIQIQGTQRAVGADATVDVGGMEGGSRLVELRASHLPPPARIQRGTQVFALWFQRQGGQTRLASIMDYDEGSREGFARATTAASSFRVILTAERNRQPGAPSDVVIFRSQAR